MGTGRGARALHWSKLLAAADPRPLVLVFVYLTSTMWGQATGLLNTFIINRFANSVPKVGIR